MATLLNIGRSKDNDIVLESQHVSGHHAQLVVDSESKVFINDLGSSNGTFVNGKKISGSHELQTGDFVVIADSHFDWTQYAPAATTISTGRTEETLPQRSGGARMFVWSLVASVAILVVFWMVNESKAGGNSSGLVTAQNTTENNGSSNGKPGDTANKNGSSSSGNGSSSGGTVDNGTGNTGTNSDGSNTGTGTGTNTNTGTVAVPSEITYDFSCVVSEQHQNSAEKGEVLDDMRDNMLGSSGIEVTVQEEMDFGTQNHEAALQGATVLNNANSQKLQTMLNRLVAKIPSPRGFTYRIFLIQSDQLNAWTCGGRIYVTTTMYDFVQSDDEMAGIIGHEIYHNELGHIQKQLVAAEYSQQVFGPALGGVAAALDGILHQPFGKRDEAHCDFKGADLCILAGYNQPCDIVRLWDRMSQSEGQAGTMSEFMRSHPLSSQRRECIKNHLKVNYNIDC